MTGDMDAAILIYCGPVHTAWGIIYPKKSTAVTEIRIAKIEGTRASRKMGRASMAAALQSRSVTSK